MVKPSPSWNNNHKQNRRSSRNNPRRPRNNETHPDRPRDNKSRPDLPRDKSRRLRGLRLENRRNPTAEAQNHNPELLARSPNSPRGRVRRSLVLLVQARRSLDLARRLLVHRWGRRVLQTKLRSLPLEEDTLQ